MVKGVAVGVVGGVDGHFGRDNDSNDPIIHLLLGLEFVLVDVL